MTPEPEEETFSVGLQFGDLKVSFFINSRSTTGKRWAFFGLMTMIVVLLFAVELEPLLTEYAQ
jgi:hypothetical protein